MSRIVSSLVQVALVALVFAVASGHQFSSYYIFYGSLFFAVDLRLAAAPGLREGRPARCCARPATSAARCSSAAASTSRPSATRCATPRTPTVNVVGFISLTPRPEQRARCRSARSTSSRRSSTATASTRSSSPTPTSRSSRRSSSSTSATATGVRVRIAPSTMELLVHRAEFVPGEAVPLFELKPPVFEGFDYVVKRTFDLAGSSLLLLDAAARCSRRARSPCGSARAGRSSTARCARGSAASRSRA